MQRNSEDTKVDNRGKQINELCISTGMPILNGITLGDSFGKFTCQKPTGASVVDYMIASEELLKDIIYFHVHPFLPIFSDSHSKIPVCIKANAKHVKSAQKVNERMPDSFECNKYSSQRFRKALEDIDLQNIISFIERKFQYDESGVENACSLFESFVLQAAGRSLNMRSSNKIKKNLKKKLYDQDLYVKRRILNTKANLMFKQPFDVSLRNSYFKHNREYRKLLKFKRKKLHKEYFFKA